MLSLALSRNWPLHQLDIKNAFLHGTLDETVYMHQAISFVDPSYPDHVFLLKRSLYGLKQAPSAWYQCFASFTSRVGFISSTCDTLLFVYHHDGATAYLLLYVDDIVLTASFDALRDNIIRLLNAEFYMTEFGPLSFFLGISVPHTKDSIFLSQSRYAEDILQRASMSSNKPARTRVDTKSKLSANSGPFVSDPTLYHSLASALQYLTFTRPDISYAVQQVCLFMHDPREPHFQALKRILRYILHTVDHGLHIY